MPGKSAEHRLAPEANRDLEAIWLYTLEEWGLKQANRYTDELTDVFAQLAVGPQLGTACDHIRIGYRRRRVDKSLLIRLPPDLHDALTRLRTERHINISAWVRSLLARELARELGPDRDPPIPLPPPPPPRPAPPLPPSLEAPLPGWRPHRLDNGDWGSIYLGDPAVLPSELVGATIVVQSRNGQSWTTTVTAVLDRGSRQVIVTDSGRLSEP